MNHPRKPGLHGWARVAVIIIPYLISVGIFQAIGFLITGAEFGKHESLTLFQSLIVSLLGFLGAFFIIGVFRVKVDKKSFRSLGFQMQKFTKDALWGLALGAGIMLLGFILLLAFSEIRIDKVQFDIASFLMGLALFVVVAFNEEVLMRGYVLNNFMDSWNKYVALTVSALIFALLHLANPNFSWIGFANIFIAGYILGLSYLYTRNLWFPIALHFSWNFFQGTVFGFHVSGNEIWSVVKQSRTADTLMNGGSFGFEGSLLILIFEVGSLAIIFLVFRNRTPEAESVLPEDSPATVLPIETTN